MYLLMNVGRYQGEVRGPFLITAARHLIATGQATKAEFDPESKTFKVRVAVPASDTVLEMAANAGDSKKPEQPRRRR